MCGFAAKNALPILFSVAPKRECAVHGVREKALISNLAPYGARLGKRVL